MAPIYSERTYKVCVCVCVSCGFWWQDSEKLALSGAFVGASACCVSCWTATTAVQYRQDYWRWYCQQENDGSANEQLCIYIYFLFCFRVTIRAVNIHAPFDISFSGNDICIYIYIYIYIYELLHEARKECGKNYIMAHQLAINMLMDIDLL